MAEDPWLSTRMAEYARIRRAEAQLYPAVRDAVDAYITQARAGLLGALTAAAGDDPEDPPGLPSESAWRRALNRFVLGPTRAIWRSSFGRITGRPDDDVPEDDNGHGEGLGDRLSGFRQAVADRINRALALGRARGESPEQLRDRVAALMTLEEWDGQVMTMTRTETMTALNAGAAHGALAEQERTGETWEKRWQATPDQRVRHTHAEADGQVRPLHDPFEIGGHPLQFPGDPKGPAGEVINCRCSARYGPAGDPALTAAAERLTDDFHGTPGRPSYRKYHPSGRNKKGASRGLRTLPSGGVLGSDRFTEEQHLEALTSYNGRGYQEMNGLLRRGEDEIPPQALDEVRRNNSALMDLIEVQQPTTSKTNLYRGMRAPRRPVFALNEGDEFHDRGFLSTSSEESTARSLAGNDEKSILFTIVTPAGSQMADMNGLRGLNNSESEFILPPGSKFRVRRILRDDREEPDEDSGPIHYELELINA